MAWMYLTAPSRQHDSVFHFGIDFLMDYPMEGLAELVKVFRVYSLQRLVQCR